MPESLRQAVAGKRPSRYFLPAMHGVSKIVIEKLLWKGSSQAGLFPLTETHLKHPMEANTGIDKNSCENYTRASI